MQNKIDCIYDKYLHFFNKELNEYLLGLDMQSPKTIRDVMSYALLNGGKRVRPILCLSVADILNIPLERVKYFAMALEMIHSYSLVHDDLPSMDNDDFRRGKPSTHKMFGEAFGVLGGDALLNLAVETCLKTPNFDINCVEAMQALFQNSGYSGMIAGQVLDLEYEKSNISDLKLLEEIFINKTSKLLISPVIISSILADKAYYDEFYNYGLNLGLFFQITDDILDFTGSLETLGKTPMKDANSNKATSVTILGIEGAKKLAKTYYNKCISSIDKVPNNQFLIDFAKKVFERQS